MKAPQKFALGLGAAALTLGGVAGAVSIAQAADPSPTPAASTAAGDTQTTQAGQGRGPGGQHGRGEMGGMKGGAVMAADLAEKLGLDEDTVADALETAHDALRPTSRPADGAALPTAEERHAALAAELAKALDVDEATITEALDALQADRQAERAADLKDRLDQAVADGKLTQAEADAVTKAVEAGVIGGGGGFGRGR